MFEKAQIDDSSLEWQWYQYYLNGLTLQRELQVQQASIEPAPTNPTPRKIQKKANRRPKVRPIEGIEIVKAKPKGAKVSQQLKAFAETLIDELKSYEFHLLRYDAKGTNSIYLKIDYGVACSVRISDHLGYDHLSYRFNAILGLKQSKTIVHKGHERHFFTLEDYRKLVTLIIIERNLKKRRYSQKTYDAFMEKNKQRLTEDTKGFFSQCHEV